VRPVVEPDRIVYQPYLPNRKWNVGAVVVGAVVFLVGLFVLPESQIRYACIGIAPVVGAYGLVRLLFFDEITLTFDAVERCVFRKGLLLPRRRVMRFDDIGSIAPAKEDGRPYYRLTRKGNVFAKGVRISLDDSESFERQILPAIALMLRTPLDTRTATSTETMFTHLRYPPA